MGTQSRPERVDALVVGAGVVGCAAAYFLREAGREVLLVDRDLPGRGASGRNPGSLAVQNKPVPMVPPAIESIGIWRQFQEMGYDMGYHCTGGFRLAETEEQAAQLRAEGEEQRRAGADLEHVTGRRIFDMAPYLSPDWVVAANYCPGDGFGNPLTALPEIVRAFAELGGVVRSRTEVLSLEESGAGVLARTRGGDILADEAVVAAGWMMSGLLRPLGFDLPYTVRAMQLMVTEPVAYFVPHMLTHMNRDLTLKQKKKEGTVLIGGGRPAVQRGDTYQADLILDNLVGNAHAAVRTIPRLREVKAIRTWGAVDGRTPDLMPMLGRVPGRPRVWYSTTCTGGYTIGPLLGRSVADAICGRTVHETVRPYLRV